MRELVKQLVSTLGAAFAAACCLGVTAIISGLTAIGAGFLIIDAVLFPLYFLLLALSVWLLYRSARAHSTLFPFWMGAGGAVIAFTGLWVGSLPVYAGLATLVAGSAIDFIRTRKRQQETQR